MKLDHIIDGLRIYSVRFVVLLFILMFWSCGTDNPITPYQPKEWKGIPDSKAFDNLELVQRLERMRRSNSSLSYIGGDVDFNGVILEGSAWYYHFFGYENNKPMLYKWKILPDGKVELWDVGPPQTRSYYWKELGQFLAINSDQAVKIARLHRAEEYIQHHPHAYVRIYYYQAETVMIKLWFYDPDTLGACEPQWWITADTGTFINTDYDHDYCLK